MATSLVESLSNRESVSSKETLKPCPTMAFVGHPILDEIKQGRRLRPTKTVDKSAPLILADGEKLNHPSRGAGSDENAPRAPPGPPPCLVPPPPPTLRSSSSSPSINRLKEQKTSEATDRSQLLNDIRGGIRLRKTVTNDKSGPVLSASPSCSSLSAQSQNADCATRSSNYDNDNSTNNLMNDLRNNAKFRIPNESRVCEPSPEVRQWSPNVAPPIPPPPPPIEAPPLPSLSPPQSYIPVQNIKLPNNAQDKKSDYAFDESNLIVTEEDLKKEIPSGKAASVRAIFDNNVQEEQVVALQPQHQRKMSLNSYLRTENDYRPQCTDASFDGAALKVTGDVLRREIPNGSAQAKIAKFASGEASNVNSTLPRIRFKPGQVRSPFTEATAEQIYNGPISSSENSSPSNTLPRRSKWAPVQTTGLMKPTTANVSKDQDNSMPFSAVDRHIKSLGARSSSVSRLSEDNKSAYSPVIGRRQSSEDETVHYVEVPQMVQTPARTNEFAGRLQDSCKDRSASVSRIHEMPIFTSRLETQTQPETSTHDAERVRPPWRREVHSQSPAPVTTQQPRSRFEMLNGRVTGGSTSDIRSRFEDSSRDTLRNNSSLNAFYPDSPIRDLPKRDPPTLQNNNLGRSGYNSPLLGRREIYSSSPSINNNGYAPSISSKYCSPVNQYSSVYDQTPSNRSNSEYYYTRNLRRNVMVRPIMVRTDFLNPGSQQSLEPSPASPLRPLEIRETPPTLPLNQPSRTVPYTYKMSNSDGRTYNGERLRDTGIQSSYGAKANPPSPPSSMSSASLHSPSSLSPGSTSPPSQNMRNTVNPNYEKAKDLFGPSAHTSLPPPRPFFLRHSVRSQSPHIDDSDADAFKTALFAAARAKSTQPPPTSAYDDSQSRSTASRIINVPISAPWHSSSPLNQPAQGVSRRVVIGADAFQNMNPETMRGNFQFNIDLNSDTPISISRR